ncbi:hypothetical protein, variant [Exophiala oligosperma]|uniref:Uncharacterized protein n=1 Tax=Exophiala oligosperma TaxID=215243 RepID=A0A0D2C9G5_9EURO|nr:hypothetical protein, variant [Exophiala oligosperma]KIW46452.1 hypothetical protein, variant [Exophiala oligosperma]
MGRRANPLIADYFERGARLDDSSNRYAHTCRRCLQVFPKGRMENMQKHLTKLCPAMSLKERLQIILRLNDLAHSDVEQNIFPHAPEREGNQVQADNSLNFPPAIHTGSQQTALEVLAEASRHLNNPVQEPSFNQFLPHTQAAYSEVPHDLPSQSHIVPQIQHDNFGSHSNDFQSSNHINDTMDHLMSTNMQVSDETFTNIPATTSAYGYDAFAGSHETTLPPLLPHTEYPDAAPEWNSLPTTSTAVESILPANNNNNNNDEVPTVESPSVAPVPVVIDLDDQTMPDSTDQPIPIDHPMPDSTDQSIPDSNDQTVPFVPQTGASGKGPRPKGRAKLSPQTKLQAAMVRKIGACSRCRALRKPCVPVDPANPRGICKLCINIKNPRIWKNTCIRPRLWEILEAYFARPRVYSVNREQSGVAWLQYHGSVNVVHFEGKTVALRARYRKPPDNALDNFSDFSIVQEDGAIAIDLENQDERMETYLKAITEDVIAREKSPMIKATLQVAYSLHIEQLANPSTDKEDKILSDVIELWTATSLMIDPELKAEFTIVSGSTGAQRAISECHNTSAYAAMAKQLQAVIENRTSFLSKPTMRRFEECCGHRNKAKSFKVFMTAFILLSCAERMCWLFRRWESDTSVPWSLIRTAGSYAEQVNKPVL